MSARQNNKPWPMKWIVAVILVFVALYTVLTLQFRKAGPAYQPYHDNKERATISRLKSAGFRRITATVERPADGTPTVAARLNRGAPAEVREIVGGISPELSETLIDRPRLAQTFDRVRATGEANRLLPYSVEFACGLEDNKQLLSGAYVYLKDDELAIVPEFETIEGDLLARTRDSSVQVTIPGGALPEGSYRVTLVGERSSKQWVLQVH